MIRRSVLLSLLVALFVPFCTYASEYSQTAKNKPFILLIGTAITLKMFVPFIKDIIDSEFNIKTVTIDSLSNFNAPDARDDIKHAFYVMAILGESISRKGLIGEDKLIETLGISLQKQKNKALVILRWMPSSAIGPLGNYFHTIFDLNTIGHAITQDKLSKVFTRKFKNMLRASAVILN